MADTEESRPVLLLTRPRSGAERFAQAFRDRFGTDWPVVVAPLIGIAPVDDGPLPDAAALIFTSETAVRAYAARAAAAGRPAWCVGARTAAAAREAGFEAIGTGPDARALAAVILARRPLGVLLHARGAQAAFPLADVLRDNGLEVREAVLYRQVDLAPDAQALALFSGSHPLLCPVFSPRSAARFAAVAAQASAPLGIAAISEAAAVACRGLARATIRVAPQPDAEGLLTALAELPGMHEAG